MASGRGKFALVIGNGRYQPPIAKLRNPVNDAAAISAELAKCGYDVTTETNLDSKQFAAVVEEFYGKASGAAAIVVYYSGHGVSISGQNYLLPTNLRLITPESVAKLASVEELISRFSSVSETTLFFFDACRSNLDSTRDATEDVGSEARKITMGDVELSEGFSEIAVPPNLGDVFIFFSTTPGKVAYDGNGQNSPFAEALLENIAHRGLGISEMTTRINSAVALKTNRTQRPWPINMLSKDFQIRAATIVPVPIATFTGLATGLISAAAFENGMLSLLQIEIFPGVLFGGMLAMVLKYWWPQTRIAVLAAMVATAWLCAYQVNDYLSYSLPRYTPQADAKIERFQTEIDFLKAEDSEPGQTAEEEQSTKEKIANLEDKIAAESLNKESQLRKQKLFVEHGKTLAAVVASAIGAGLTFAFFALLANQGKSILFFALTMIAGGLTTAAAGIYAQYFGSPDSRNSVQFVVWQMSVATLIAWSFASRPPPPDDSLREYFAKPIFARQNFVLTVLLVLSSVASSVMTTPRGEFFKSSLGGVLEGLQGNLLLWGTPFGPAILFGAVVSAIVWSKTRGLGKAAIAYLCIFAAWHAAVQTTIYLLDVVPTKLVFPIGGLLSAVIMQIGLSIVLRTYRDSYSFVVLAGTSVVMTFPFVYMVVDAKFLTEFDQLPQQWLMLYLPWQVGVGLAVQYIQQAHTRLSELRSKQNHPIPVVTA